MAWLCDEHGERVHASACTRCLQMQIDALTRTNLGLRTIVKELGSLLVENTRVLRPITEKEARRIQTLLETLE